MPSELQARGAYRPDDAAAFLGFKSRDSLERLIAKGLIKSYKVGAARFISTAELERFIREREQGQSS